MTLVRIVFIRITDVCLKSELKIAKPDAGLYINPIQMGRVQISDIQMMLKSELTLVQILA